MHFFLVFPAQRIRNKSPRVKFLKSLKEWLVLFSKHCKEFYNDAAITIFVKFYFLFEMIQGVNNVIRVMYLEGMVGAVKRGHKKTNGNNWAYAAV